MASLAELISRDEGIRELWGNAKEFVAGVSRGLSTDLAGAPVDLINAGLKAVGVPTSDKPFLGSKYLREKSAIPTEDSQAALAGNISSMLVNPSALLAKGGALVGALRAGGRTDLFATHAVDTRKLERFLSNSDHVPENITNLSYAISRHPEATDFGTNIMLLNPDNKLINPATNPDSHLFNRDVYSSRAKDQDGIARMKSKGVALLKV